MYYIYFTQLPLTSRSQCSLYLHQFLGTGSPMRLQRPRLCGQSRLLETWYDASWPGCGQCFSCNTVSQMSVRHTFNAIKISVSVHVYIGLSISVQKPLHFWENYVGWNPKLVSFSTVLHLTSPKPVLLKYFDPAAPEIWLKNFKASRTQ
jgi:hypothetical protein